jgi:uncharacterized protein YjbJ (UPF0337 family)
MADCHFLSQFRRLNPPIFVISVAPHQHDSPGAVTVALTHPDDSHSRARESGATMDKQTPYRPINGSGKVGHMIRTLDSKQTLPIFTKLDHAPHSRSKTGGGVPYSGSNIATESLFAEIFSDDAEKLTLLAANEGIDDQRAAEMNAINQSDQQILLAQQQQAAQEAQTAKQIRDYWKPQVNAARIKWGKLSEEELIRSDGNQQTLVGLIQKRYGVTREDAETQVGAFFGRR